MVVNSERKKILLIGMSSSIGGIETYLYNLVKTANKEAFQFDFIGLEKSKIAFEDELKDLGCKIYKIVPRTKNFLKHIHQLKDIYLYNNYDYIHYSIMSYSWFEPIVLADKYSKAQIIIHSHTAGFDKKVKIKTRMMHKIGKKLVHRIHFYAFACSKQAGKFAFDKRNVFIFNNGVDIDRYKFNIDNRKSIRNENDIKDEDIVFGLIARLEREKNCLFLIEVFYEINKLIPNSKLLIVGEGSLKEQIVEAIKKYKIDKNVILLGKRLDVDKIYSAFDLFIMPSLYEGISFSIVEAQINGLKCYTSDKVDKASNLTGNIKFLSLNDNAVTWADKILNDNYERDYNVLEKIPEEYNSKRSYQKVYNFYNEHYYIKQQT